MVKDNWSTTSATLSKTTTTMIPTVLPSRTTAVIGSYFDYLNQVQSKMSIVTANNTKNHQCTKQLGSDFQKQQQQQQTQVAAVTPTNKSVRNSSSSSSPWGDFVSKEHFLDMHVC